MSINAIILGAGKGTRMNSDLPKVLHTINNKPMIQYIIDTCKESNIKNIVLVAGHKSELVKKTIGIQVSYALQEKQLGTGHAVMSAKELLENQEGTTLILCGDTPLLSSKTLNSMIARHKSTKSSATILTTHVKEPKGYGRIIRDDDDDIVLKIVEEKDAKESEKKIKEINSGTYCFDNQLLFEMISKINNNNAQGEYYITDMIQLLVENNKKVSAFPAKFDEVIGVNTQESLKTVEFILNKNKED